MAVNAAPPAVPGRSPFHFLAGALWRLLVLLVLLLAIYVAAGRALMGNVATLQDELLAALNERLPFALSAASVSGRMDAFSPELVFEDLRFAFPGEAVDPVQLHRGSLRLAPLRSLLTLSPQASVVTLSGLSVELHRDADGRLALRGFGRPGADGGLRGWLADFLPRVRSLTLEDNRVLLRRDDAPGRRGRVDLTLRRSGSQRTLDARIESAAGNRATVHAEGIGDPLALDTWRGDVYVGLEAEALERVFDWLPGTTPVRAAGKARAGLWLQRAGGRSDLRLTFAGSALTLFARGGSWSVPLESLAMDAALEERQGGWLIHASDLGITQAGRSWLMPRAEFELLGDSLRARTSAFRLDGIEGLCAAVPTMPPQLADALQQLRPRGRVQALALSIEDLRAPSRGWRLTARADDVAVDSWRGAPGVQGVSAFARLGPGGGTVRVDSENVSLALPRVYEAPLTYASAHGDLDLAWSGGGFELRSGLLTASGDEGTARALLTLSIPFSESAVGPAMELLVGLRDSDARYRAKYLPYRLPEPLRDWLGRSIVAGRVETGGFAWRGSLRKGNRDHLTVQLYFDVADAQIDYDPRWPPVQGFDGRLLGDDARISVWGERGRVGGGTVKRLSAELWRVANRDLLLAVDAAVAGDAADALALINDSPLANRLGGTLTEARASGPVRADLALALPMRDAAPRVEVEARLGGVTFRAVPSLPAFEDVEGPLRYDSDSGLSSDALSGTLRDSTVGARIDQEGADAPLRVLLSANALPLASLHDLLPAGTPFPASGATALQAELTLGGGAAPALALESDLVGVALALPEPWGKTAEEARPMAAELRAAADGLAVELTLGERLEARLRLVEGKPRAGFVRLEADWLQGALELDEQPPRLLIDRLDLDALPGSTGELDFEALRAALGTVTVDVLELRRGGKALGEVAFELARDGESILARGIRGELFGLRSTSEEGGLLRWRGGEGEETSLELDLAFDDLGQVFTALGYAPTLVSERGSARATLSWPGPPSAFLPQTLRGSVALRARDGRVLDARGSGGALKVVTLLNLAEILRGLSLAQMFESGIPFERAASEFLFREGRVEIPALTLRGAASAFEFSGITDFQRIDGELVVTLPVANNLPWVAALAGGLPVAAGVYVVSKVFEKQVNRMSSGVYEVSGPLGDPEVELRRIFDDTASAPAAPQGDAAAPDPNTAAPAAPQGDAERSSRR